MSDELSFSLCRAIAEYRDLALSCATWPEPPPFPDPGEPYCNLQHRLIAELPTLTVGPHKKALRDRRDARMDAVGTGRALDSRDVFAGAETLRACSPPSGCVGRKVESAARNYELAWAVLFSTQTSDE
jgi:hypothetical protein